MIGLSLQPRFGFGPPVPAGYNRGMDIFRDHRILYVLAVIGWVVAIALMIGTNEGFRWLEINMK